nr:hypothetical protein [Tanacetum cinerariifolium]
MREEGCASWDRRHSTWGGRGESFGTVSVLLGVREGSIGEGGILGGKNTSAKLTRAKPDKYSREASKSKDMFGLE